MCSGSPPLLENSDHLTSFCANDCFSFRFYVFALDVGRRSITIISVIAAYICIVLYHLQMHYIILFDPYKLIVIVWELLPIFTNN